jgi:hypothetical protein
MGHYGLLHVLSWDMPERTCPSLTSIDFPLTESLSLFKVRPRYTLLPTLGATRRTSPGVCL